MGNHFHLLVETPEPNLSHGMAYLNSLYAQRFNRRDGRVGHVFQGRFHAVLLEREAHLMELSRYVVLNPVRAGMCTAPGEWPWSSYQATAGDVPRPVFLTVDWLLEQFGTETAQAREEYRRFIAASSPARPWDDLRGQIYLGTESFIAEHVPIRANPREIARAQREPLRPSLAKILGTAASGSRLLEARSHGYRLREIGEHLGVHHVTVRRRLRRLERPQHCSILRPDPDSGAGVRS